MLDNDAATAHLLHSVQTAEVAGAKDRSREALMVAAENLSAEGMDPADPILREPNASAIDAALRADDDYEPEVEEEVDRRREDDRISRYGMNFFIPFGIMLALCGLLTPTTPTPIDDSLSPSSLHDAGRTMNPAPVTDGWRGFLWTT